jgi:hypothetical protein
MQKNLKMGQKKSPTKAGSEKQYPAPTATQNFRKIIFKEKFAENLRKFAEFAEICGNLRKFADRKFPHPPA